MITKRTHSVLAIIATLIGANAVSAGNDQPWHYDEDSDTVVYRFVGYPAAPEAPNASQQTVRNLPWHYDEERDTVVYNFVGQPVAPVAAIVTQQRDEDTAWYYDEERDRVIYKFVERSGEQTTVFAGMTE